MRTPARRHVVDLESLQPGDYILAERKGEDGLADIRQGTVDVVGKEEHYEKKGLLLRDGKILFDDDGWTYVLLEKGK